MSHTHTPRRSSSRRNDRRRGRLTLEPLESRQLMAGGPLTITITEVQTGQTVTIVDNSTTVGEPVTTVDGDPAPGSILYSTPTGASDPFTDFAITGLTGTSNRATASTAVLLTQSGTIQRTTTTGGPLTLQITVSDTGFTNPTNPQSLISASDVTFTNPTPSDQSTFVSTAAGTSTPPIVLQPSTTNNPDTESGSVGPIALPPNAAAPYNVSNTYTFTLGPNSAGGATTVTFNATGETELVGSNSPPPPPPIQICGYKFNDLNGDGVWEANGIDPVKDAHGNPITTAPEPGLGGVTIALYTDTNGTLSKAPVQTTVTSSAAATLGYYSFTNLAPLPAGTSYAVREVVPAGWVETTANPADIPGTPGTSANNVDFGNVMADCGCGYTIVCETVIGPCGPTQISGLRGHTQQGEVLTITYTVPQGKTADLSLVSYTAPGASFNANTASQQVVFDEDSPGTVGPGTHTLTVQIPNCDYQVDLVCGGVIDKLGPAGSNVFYTPQGRLIDADNEGTEAQLTNPASLSGLVYVDTNDNGKVDGGESGLAGVTVQLTGTDTFGQKVSLTRITGADGSYSFLGLQPGKYTVSEVQPGGYVTTANSIGTVNGNPDGHLATPTTNAIDSVILGLGNNGVAYDFGEMLTGSSVCRGATQTCSFWHGSSGQALIKCFDSGSSCTDLGNWLAQSFPNLYGNKSCNLAGQTNAQVAAYYQSLYNANSSSAEVQVLATALNVYASSSALGGCSAAVSCGFTVTNGGLGCETSGVGSCGGLFGLWGNSSVIQLLQCANDQASNGSFSGLSGTNRSRIASLFSGICSY